MERDESTVEQKRSSSCLVSSSDAHVPTAPCKYPNHEIPKITNFARRWSFFIANPNRIGALRCIVELSRQFILDITFRSLHQVTKDRAERQWNFLHFVNRGNPNVVCPHSLHGFSEKAVEYRQGSKRTPKVVALAGFQGGREKCVEGARALVLREVQNSAIAIDVAPPAQDGFDHRSKISFVAGLHQCDENFRKIRMVPHIGIISRKVELGQKRKVV